MQQQEPIYYKSDFGAESQNVIHETLDPFRGEFPDRVIKFLNACERFIDAESDDGKIQVAEETGYNYNYLKNFCKTKYKY